MSSEKTHDPTAERLKKARKQGDTLQSRELATALIFAGGVAAIFAIGPWMLRSLMDMMIATLTIVRGDVWNFDPTRAIGSAVATIVVPLLLLLLIPAIAAFAAPALIGSLGFNGQALAFKGSRINPGAGLKRMFSTQGLVELGKAVAKTVLVGGVGIWLVLRQIGVLEASHAFDVASQSRDMVLEAGFALAMLAAALVLIALIDVPIQYLRRQARLRMTRQEVVDDHKQGEGSPELKAAIRRRQHETLSRSVHAAMAEAHVVITNPTHFAVALRYDPDKDAAPVILAKGCDAKAAAMRSLAADCSAVMVSHPSLARAIYFTGREGEQISPDLFRAVATVLAFVRQVDRMATADIERMAPIPPNVRYDRRGQLESEGGGLKT